MCEGQWCCIHKAYTRTHLPSRCINHIQMCLLPESSQATLRVDAGHATLLFHTCKPDGRSVQWAAREANGSARRRQAPCLQHNRSRQGCSDKTCGKHTKRHPFSGASAAACTPSRSLLTCRNCTVRKQHQSTEPRQVPCSIRTIHSHTAKRSTLIGSTHHAGPRLAVGLNPKQKPGGPKCHTEPVKTPN